MSSSSYAYAEWNLVANYEERARPMKPASAHTIRSCRRRPLQTRQGGRQRPRRQAEAPVLVNGEVVIVCLVVDVFEIDGVGDGG